MLAQRPVAGSLIAGLGVVFVASLVSVPSLLEPARALADVERALSTHPLAGTIEVTNFTLSNKPVDGLCFSMRSQEMARSIPCCVQRAQRGVEGLAQFDGLTFLHRKRGTTFPPEDRALERTAAMLETVRPELRRLFGHGEVFRKWHWKRGYLRHRWGLVFLSLGLMLLIAIPPRPSQSPTGLAPSPKVVALVALIAASGAGIRWGLTDFGGNVDSEHVIAAQVATAMAEAKPIGLPLWPALAVLGGDLAARVPHADDLKVASIILAAAATIILGWAGWLLNGMAGAAILSAVSACHPGLVSLQCRATPGSFLAFSFGGMLLLLLLERRGMATLGRWWPLPAAGCALALPGWGIAAWPLALVVTRREARSGLQWSALAVFSFSALLAQAPSASEGVTAWEGVAFLGGGWTLTGVLVLGGVAVAAWQLGNRWAGGLVASIAAPLMMCIAWGQALEEGLPWVIPTLAAGALGAFAFSARARAALAHFTVSR